MLVLLTQILQQIKGDDVILNMEDGATTIANPSTAAEDARLASLISLDSIMKQVKVFIRLYLWGFILLYETLVSTVICFLTGYNEANLCECPYQE